MINKEDIKEQITRLEILIEKQNELEHSPDCVVRINIDKPCDCGIAEIELIRLCKKELIKEEIMYWKSKLKNFGEELPYIEPFERDQGISEIDVRKKINAIISVLNKLTELHEETKS